MFSLMAALTLATTVSASNSNILVATVSASDSFDIQVDGELFASSAPVVVTLAGLEFSKRKGNLVSKTRTNSTGTDLLGSYSEHRTAWTAGTTAFETAVRVYSDAVMYEQHWPEGATNSKGGGGGGSVAKARVVRVRIRESLVGTLHLYCQTQTAAHVGSWRLVAGSLRRALQGRLPNQTLTLGTVAAGRSPSTIRGVALSQ